MTTSTYNNGIYYYKKSNVSVSFNFGVIPNNIIDTFLHNLS